MTTLNNIRNILIVHKEELRRKYYVSEIGIFGSYIKNEQDENSDVDILVEFEKAIDLFTFINLKYFLPDLLGINIDLVMKKALKPKIGQRILDEVVTL
ncbi:MAG: nucleotidyltransferase family protein [Ignavibacteria bacterium]|nr:nucleotidyltransferase family protein [Ignavibacteria bacterium]